MGLKYFTNIFEARKEEFERTVRQTAEGITLQHIMDELEDKKPSDTNNGVFVFSEEHYRIAIKKEILILKAYDGLVVREFSGREVSNYYDKIFNNFS